LIKKVITGIARKKKRSEEEMKKWYCLYFGKETRLPLTGVVHWPVGLGGGEGGEKKERPQEMLSYALTDARRNSSSGNHAALWPGKTNEGKEETPKGGGGGRTRQKKN